MNHRRGRERERRGERERKREGGERKKERWGESMRECPRGMAKGGKGERIGRRETVRDR